MAKRLRKPQEQWPKPKNWRAMEYPEEAKIELKIHTVLTQAEQLEVFIPGPDKCIPLLEYSERLSTIINILAYVKRFAKITRQRAKERKEKKQIVTIKRVSKEHLKKMKNNEFRLEFIHK